MLQTHTPGGEPTQSCREKGHTCPGVAQKGAWPSQGTQHLSQPAGSRGKAP